MVGAGHPLIRQAGYLAAEWHALLSQRNAFVACESALHGFALGAGETDTSIAPNKVL